MYRKAKASDFSHKTPRLRLSYKVIAVMSPSGCTEYVYVRRMFDDLWSDNVYQLMDPESLQTPDILCRPLREGVEYLIRDDAGDFGASVSRCVVFLSGEVVPYAGSKWSDAKDLVLRNVFEAAMRAVSTGGRRSTCVGTSTLLFIRGV